MTQELNVHIETLALYGFALANRHRIGDAVAHELKRLIRERGLPTSVVRDGDLARLQGGTIRISHNSGVDKISGQIAKSVHEGFGK
ncbi:MAG: hypothetical protein PVF97_00110 [Desulfobacterales bacterium]